METWKLGCNFFYWTPESCTGYDACAHGYPRLPVGRLGPPMTHPRFARSRLDHHYPPTPARAYPYPPTTHFPCKNLARRRRFFLKLLSPCTILYYSLLATVYSEYTLVDSCGQVRPPIPTVCSVEFGPPIPTHPLVGRAHTHPLSIMGMGGY